LAVVVCLVLSVFLNLRLIIAKKQQNIYDNCNKTMPSHPEASLKAGLTALKQEDYQKAKAILEKVATTAGDRTEVVQAQIGLVVIYARTDELPKAIALCEALCENEHVQVQQWAQATLPKLKKLHNEPEVTGFVILKDLPPATPVTAHTFPGNFQHNKVENEQDTGSLAIHTQQPTQKANNNSQLTTNASSQSAGATINQEKTKPKGIYWRHAGRAKVWQPLPKRGLKLLWLLEIGTFLALFWVIRTLLVWLVQFTNNILARLPLVEPIHVDYSSLNIFLLVLLLLLTCLSPWLLDWLLTAFYQQRLLDKDTLHRHSKETVRVLQRYCQQRSWQIPKLRVVAIAAPVAFTYGYLSRNARIVVSQGLLEQLTDEEIATIYASQLGHIANWDCTVMSLVLLVTIPVYLVYMQMAGWGDRTQKQKWRLFFGILASLLYCLWCLLVGTALWLSQLRLYHSDRTSAEVTGNPNGLVRALLKTAVGISEDIQQQQCTDWRLESLNIVLPVGYKQSLYLGTIASHTTFESLLMWDCFHPYRRWFVINNTHPLLGERLQRLCQIARQWHVAPELYLEQPPFCTVKLQSFLLQIAPFLGIPLGIVVAVLIWLAWQIAFALGILNLKWIYDDWHYLTGCMAIGFSIGTSVRINSFFPDIKATTAQTEENLTSILTNPALLPIDSISVRLVGKLLGRQGISNYLGQDLILQSPTGLIKLHYIPGLRKSTQAQDLIGRQVTITGWLRRGATPWIDIQTLQTQSGKILNSYHPIWSLVLAVAAEVWGAYILLKG
jgi:Zn-dependent protease with chaperone function